MTSDQRRDSTAVRRGIGRVLLVLLVPVLVAGFVPGANSQAAPALSGFATGTVVHADALNVNGLRLADVEAAFSTASARLGGDLGAALSNEMSRVAQPALAGKNGYGRGSALEVGLVHAPDAENQLILAGKAEASSPPAGAEVKEIGPIPANPLAYVSLFKGTANASLGATASDACATVGKDLASGVARAADVQLLNAGGTTADGRMAAPLVATDHDAPDRGVIQSSSRTLLVPQVARGGASLGPNFGVMSEVRQTIAPITLFRGTPVQMTIEFLGEWVLQVVATGVPGQAYVHFGPGTVSPETGVLRLLDAADKVTNVLTTQQLLGVNGLSLVLPDLAEIAIGEAPRAIGGAYGSAPETSADGTTASAAVDVVRIRLLPSSGILPLDDDLVDVRIGHMEARAQVQSGGISCPLSVAKVAAPSSVTVAPQGGNDVFTTTITVTNPYACPVENVSVVDAVRATGNAEFAVTGTQPSIPAPGGTNLKSVDLAWNGLGTIPPGASTTGTATFRATAAPGEIRDTATATGNLACPPDSALGGTNVAGVTVAKIGVSGQGTLAVPVNQVLGVTLARTGPASARTLAIGFVVMSLGVVVRYLARQPL